MMFQCCSSAAEEARKEIYVQKFLHIAGLLNEQLSTTPLLYGSLGLERRLSADLNADDIDVLILEKFLKDVFAVRKPVHIDTSFVQTVINLSFAQKYWFSFSYSR